MATKKRNINDLTASALKGAGEQPEHLDEGTHVLDDLEAEDTDPPAVSLEDPATVFSAAAQRLVHNLYIVADPKIKTGQVVGGETQYMTELQMYGEYKGLIAGFRRSVAALPEPARSICFEHLRAIESMTRQVRFNPTGQPRSETVIMRQKHDLKRNILASVENCKRDLAAKLPKQATA